MLREPPIHEPVHHFENVEDIVFYCDQCETEESADVDSLEDAGVGVYCPGCGEHFFIDLDVE